MAILAAQCFAGDIVKLEKTIPLPKVDGRIDHLAVDLAGKRLFVAALGNNTVEVIDISGLRVIKSIAGLHEPQGIRFLPDRNRHAQPQNRLAILPVLLALLLHTDKSTLLYAAITILYHHYIQHNRE